LSEPSKARKRDASFNGLNTAPTKKINPTTDNSFIAVTTQVSFQSNIEAYLKKKTQNVQ
jgi:hypothetical protein